MSWSTRNAGKHWTPEDDKFLKKLAKGDTPTRVAAFKLGRSPEAVYDHAAGLGITLKPVNQSPYNRLKK